MAVSKQIDLDDRLNPWDRQGGEKEPKPGAKRQIDYYSWFTSYQVAGRGRSVPELANELGKSVSYLQRIAWAYRWKERAQAWDIEENARRAILKSEERDKADDRRAKLGKVFFHQSALLLAQPGLDAKRTACRLAETGMRLDLSVYGSPDKALSPSLIAGPGGEAAALLMGPVPGTEEERLEQLAHALARVTQGQVSMADFDPYEFEEDAPGADGG